MMPSLELVITSEGQGGSDEQGEESGSSSTPPPPPPLKQPPPPNHTRAATASRAATRNSSTTTTIAITTEHQNHRRDDRLVVTELDDDDNDRRQHAGKGRLALAVGQEDFGGDNYGGDEEEEEDDEEEEERGGDQYPWTTPSNGIADPGNGRPGVHDQEDGIEGWWTGGGPVATVKMVMETGVGVITRAWPLHQPARNLRLELSRATQVPPHFLQLILRGRVLSDVSTLRDMGVEANETVQVGVSSKRPHTHPLTLLAPTTPTIPTPDVITVIVAEAGIGEREVVVEVEWAGGRKPWLGGFRHKVSGLHYHNATTQTHPPRRPRAAQVTRGTQTVKTRPCGTQTCRNAHTQTTHHHPLLLTPMATLLTPMAFSPAHRYDVSKVVEVQRMVRGWLARKRVRRLKQERRRLNNSTSESTTASTRQVDSANSISDNSISTTSSHKRWRGAVPMAELYSRLEAWRRRQVAQITASLTGQERRRALVALLDKETELLRSLEAHRAVRSARRRNAAITLFLQEVSRAQVWKVGGRAGGVEVETPETEPVRTLASLASALQQDASAEVRGQQFNSVFNTVERFRPSHGDPDETSRTARELGTLARRGLHLLARGTSDSRLRGLRKRLHALIITYLQQVQTRSSVPMQPRLVRAAGGKPLLVPTTNT
ncbi:IQ and ubiquitin-like domain-containing protein [Penaeus japonicus]|uniref:IQ and ubiquitin-like domain-containing protein n=1 Tax=Penaeus japonicus TaxID=27405 RepID=UPI001C712A45|nr:IQ and ubiquitin-like domain-containing protein [Penaeus japonicus]